MSIRKKGVVLISVAAIFSGLWVWHSESTGQQVSTTHAQLVQASDWTTPEAQRLGIRLMDVRDSSGPPAYSVAPGDLLFFTNAGNAYASRNTKNSVVVINAKTKKPIVVSDLDSHYTEDYGSHGIGMSPDGKYIYLPNIENIGSPGSKTPNSTLILDARTLKIYQVIASLLNF